MRTKDEQQLYALLLSAKLLGGDWRDQARKNIAVNQAEMRAVRRRQREYRWKRHTHRLMSEPSGQPSAFYSARFEECEQRVRVWKTINRRIKRVLRLSDADVAVFAAKEGV